MIYYLNVLVDLKYACKHFAKNILVKMLYRKQKLMLYQN